MKERIIKQCLRCGHEYHNAYVSEFSSKEFSKCPWCYAYESLVAQGGSLCFRIVRTEVWESHVVWYKPWTWGSGVWRTKVTEEVAELEKMLPLRS